MQSKIQSIHSGPDRPDSASMPPWKLPLKGCRTGAVGLELESKNSRAEHEEANLKGSKDGRSTSASDLEKR